MIGAILGDIIGSPYEFDRGNKTKDFPLFSDRSRFTDDTVMTIAVAEAFMEMPKDASDEEIRQRLITSLRRWGKRYPRAGYGMRFNLWLKVQKPVPYNSFGNGSAMRVSPVAWIYDDLASVLHAAKLSAEITHNHPEGIKGAQATAAAIFLARKKHSKDEIKAYITENFEYDLGRTCDEIRPDYRHVESCQESVPEAITAFLEGENFEDVIRTAVSLGGDTDTIAAIAGSIAEAYYEVPATLRDECIKRLTMEMVSVLLEFPSCVEDEEEAEQDRLYGRYENEHERLNEAIHFAVDMHENQLRKGTTIPYILHPLEVMSILQRMEADTNLLIAGVLHDTIEDTEATYEQILNIFGEDVANLVAAHSEDKSKSWDERKTHAITHLGMADKRLKMLVMADKISNLRSLDRDYRVLGDTVWERFNAPRDRHAWYYAGVCGALEEVRDDPTTALFYKEMQDHRIKVFGGEE